MSALPLTVKHLFKSFGRDAARVEILKDISFEAKNGEFIAVMGPSGSGKSTLLHVIVGLTEISGGEVLIAGESVQGMSDSKLTVLRRQKLGFIFQAFNLIPALSVEDNIVLPVLADGRKVDHAALKALGEKLGIADKFKRRPSNLSGGEQQRVAIARALLASPALILADEPTGSLDTVSGQALCELLSGFCEKENRTIIMVTHEPAVAAWAHRALILKDGKLIAEIKRNGPPSTHTIAMQYQDALERSAE